MKATEFAALYGTKGLAAWEAAAVDLARRGEVMKWPLVPVSLSATLADGALHTLVVYVTSDFFAVGEPDDFLRLPLTVGSAQEVADVWGMFLPTTAISKAIAEQAEVRIPPTPISPYVEANFPSYVKHNATINAQIAQLGGRTGSLVAGAKKHIVIGKLLTPNKVVIYNWPNTGAIPPGPDPAPQMTVGWRVQPYSNIHAGTYSFVDYSHGEQYVSPDATLDGHDVKLADILQDPTYAKLASWEGPLSVLRYPTRANPIAPGLYATNATLYDRGLAVIIQQRRDLRKS